ncbi:MULTISPECIES: MSMEG_1061 family FMN-dependent PPOX-type flavoprotein [unclassified Imperialibacter]|uniref:MSMEG_1061 family FMN-dependent PPOX-type flavoprotein n=1 Tax=unclassified Imperialibacter TaxID=2629706 RepID=UPI0012567C58|nr:MULTISPECIES: MSMEG_1061 family FMN-dependent PPOX-type flavoprotein [unclassified Imperialibacter]CAD5279356.1 Phosphohydrolase [Imperialibacter sp. 89]CAD5293393.1 Phosphohydrolase [Imperialibacter sp. 75]VVS98844.1 Phosphohydrolase [Imperialibacter sp. EC-SDR9]
MEWAFKKMITAEKQLRDLMGYPSEIVTRKTIDHIDEHCKSFIEKSPFITIATSDLKGNLDVSPKGDPAGFVKILSDKVLAIPDRPGNHKADTLTNIIQNPNIGLIFLIPGIKETLRVNGEAKIVTDEKVLELLSCQGKKPGFAIIVTVKEAFIHCAKCIIRSNLWTTVDERQERSIATLGKALVDHGKLDISSEELDEMIKDDEKTNLY